MKKTDSIKTILHLQNKDYIYRYVLVDRFKYTSTAHQGFDKHLELTEAEIFALVKPRQLRRKYIIKKV
jgi:thymidylate kinase